MDNLFEFIKYILELSFSHCANNSAENGATINLHSTIPRIYELLVKWVDEEICGLSAIKLLITLLDQGRIYVKIN